MLDIHKIYESNAFGKFKVVEYIDSSNVEVEFIDTGYRVNATAFNIKHGQLKDKLKPTVYGIGYVGDGRHKPSINKKNTKAYCTWVNMLERCNSSEYQARRPNYKGCVVAKTWHNFQNFAEWFECNYIDGYQLDKDKLVDGNKVYSPETCVFLSQQENTAISTGKRYKFVSPDGNVVDVFNLSRFCRENGLDRTAMSLVNSGKLNQHKQWSVAA